MDRIDELERRIDRLEQSLREIRELTQAPAGTPATTPRPAPLPARRESSVLPLPPPFAPPAPKRSRPTGDFEANLLGNWFARIGAFAIFLGAAFAFVYAVDRNLIPPAGRVAIGLLVGGAFVGWGEWAYRRTWPLFAQAVAGVGVAIGYLALWAGYYLYDLMPAMVALVVLGGVVIGGVFLALRHDSMPLAVLATLGGFLNPILVSTGGGDPATLHTYLLLLNIGVLALSRAKGWRTLQEVAAASTWILLFTTTLALRLDGEPQDMAGLTFATVFVLIFYAASILNRRRAAPSGEADIVLISLNAAAYFLFGLIALPEPSFASFAIVLGLAHLAAGGVAAQSADKDGNLLLALSGLGVIFTTIAASLQFEGPVLATVWALEAIALAGACAVLKDITRLAPIAPLLLGLSVLTSLLDTRFGAAYRPQTPLLSLESLPFLVQIAGLALAGAALRRRTSESGRNARLADLAGTLANGLALIWMSYELWAAYSTSPDWSPASFTFGLSSVWTLHACGLMAFGISVGARWARLASVAIFGLVITKLALIDIWLLETPMRIAAFIGLGFVLLGCSLGYHRFRALILGSGK